MIILHPYYVWTQGPFPQEIRFYLQDISLISIARDSGLGHAVFFYTFHPLSQWFFDYQAYVLILRSMASANVDHRLEYEVGDTI